MSKYNNIVSDISTKYGITEANVINSMPRTLKNSLYEFGELYDIYDVFWKKFYYFL
jgi:hypothetical protein